MKVGPGTRVTLHFSLLLESGDEIDTTRRGAPATFVMGDGTLPVGFERPLIGLEPGANARLTIPAAEGFGERIDRNVRRLPRTRFTPDIVLETGLVVSFAADQGELPGVVLATEGDMVVVDFNHPLAGRDLVFDVSVLGVETAA